MKRRTAVMLLSCLSWMAGEVRAELAFDMREGVTDISQRVQALHHLSFAVCVVVGVIVFGAMFYSIYAHRRSKRPQAAQFHDNTRVEIIWTLIPTAILIGMAIPATATLIRIEDNSDADLTVLITGSQWKWHYQYVDAGIGYYSNFSVPRAQVENREAKSADYPLLADRPLVLPTNKKVRFLTTSRDVIHSWWVPDFAVKQDAIPGFINEAWTRVDQPGTYRGQCAELCGKDHAYMPVVVEVRPEAEFDRWLSTQKQALALASQEAVEARKKQWSMAELLPRGEEVFVQHCATCHQPNGLGQAGKYPALSGSPIVTGDLAGHLDRVMNGKAGTEMQAWAPQLSDLELAAVMTYERNSWANRMGDVIQPLTVYEAR